VVELNLEEQPGSAMEDDEEDAYEDELDDVSSVTFTVNITKKDRILAFECESDGDSVTINHLELLTEPESEEDCLLPSYTGPVFADLDDTLKQAFVDYLEERFITAELGAYLITLTADKSWNEYMDWLTKVKGFIAER
jgi:complement component 1 Q subcomponent-binding protein, mitochondrial